MKFGLLLYGLLWMILGNPIIAIIVLLIILYAVDRRFVGMFPNVFRPWQLKRRLRKALRDVRERPFDVSAKQECARLYMEKKRWKEAARLLEEMLPNMDHSAEVHCDLGISLLQLGDVKTGEEHIRKALKINPRVRYGEPYLRLAEAYIGKDLKRAVEWLEHFREANTSSCESHYRLGRLYGALDRNREAKDAYEEAVEVYRSLPKYKRRTERRWALLAWVRKRMTH